MMSAKDLANALEATPETVRQKLLAAIKETGLYHPRVGYTHEQLAAIHRLKGNPVRNVTRAEEAIRLVSLMGQSKWKNAWTELKRGPGVHVYTLWKLTGPEGKQLKTPYDMMSMQKFNRTQLKYMADVLELFIDEPKEGRQWPPPAATGARPVEPDNLTLSEMDALTPVLAQAALNGVPERPRREEPEELVSPVQHVPVVEVPHTPELNAPTRKPETKTKKDVKELLAMLNEALLSANVTSLKMTVSASGPSCELEQVVVRHCTSVDDLE